MQPLPANAATARARRIFNAFVAARLRVTIYSDGNLDGMGGTGLLLQYLDRRYPAISIASVHFPTPADRRGFRVHDALLVELPPTKGLRYTGDNLLLDHHDTGPAVIHYRDGVPAESAPMPARNIRSVTDLIRHLLGSDLPLTSKVAPVLRAIRHIDQGNYTAPLDRALHRAYRLSLQATALRLLFTEWVRHNQWNKVIEWAAQESRKWPRVEQFVDRLVTSAKKLIDDVVYFTYAEEDAMEAAAMRETMFKLEEHHTVVIALSVDGTSAREASVATTSGPDLTPLFATFRERSGITAGGRAKVGGVQFPPETSVAHSLRLLTDAFRQTYSEWR